MENIKENINSQNLFISCPICFKNFTNDVKIVTLNCGHYFCQGCLSNSNFQTFFKCSICRCINTSYDYTNTNLIDLFNFVCSEYQITKPKEEKENIFCFDCEKIINFKNYHLKEFPNHRTINEKTINKKLSDGKLKINAIEKKIESLNLVGIIKSEFKFENFNKIIIKQLNKKFLKISEGLLIDKLFKLENKFELKNEYNLIKNQIEKFNSVGKSIKKMDNKSILEDFNKIFLSFHKHQKNIKNKLLGKYITSYIKNTKKVVVFDVDDLQVEIYEISDLPFTFHKNSHSVEYDANDERIYISGGKQDIFNHSHIGNKIWEYSIHNEKLKIVNTLENELIDHRSFIKDDYLYIIGGRKGNHVEKLDIYYSNIYMLNKISDKIENIFQLKFARSNFGLAYENMQLYLSFGLTNGGRFINNIEIFNLITNSSHIIQFSNCNLNLKDIGTIIDDENDQIIILGGESENKIKNSKIFNLDLFNCEVIKSIEIKEIASGIFTTYGTKYNHISAIMSTLTENEEIPHVYLFSETNKKWTCHPIDIY